MQKRAFLVASLISLFFSVFSCKMPHSLQIKKNMDSSIPINMSLDNLISSKNLATMEKDTEQKMQKQGVRIRRNTAPDLLTFVVCIPMYIDDNSITNIEERPLYQYVNSSLRAQTKPPFEEFPDFYFGPLSFFSPGDSVPLDFLNDIREKLGALKFKKIETQLYFYTNHKDLADMTDLNMSIDNGPKKKAIGVDETWFNNLWNGTTVTWPELPYYDQNEDIDLKPIINLGTGHAGELLPYKYDITITGQISKEKLDLDNFIFHIFALISIPVDLEATSGSASFDLVSQFELDFGDDLFGRKIAGEKNDLLDAFNVFNVELELNKNPFKNGKLIVDGYSPIGVIPGGQGANSLFFNLNGSTINLLRENLFSPGITFQFDQGTGFSIPQDFRIKRLIIKAALDYQVF